MSVSEWGPKNGPKENQLFREVTRFSRFQLQDVDNKARGYLQNDPRLTRAQLVDQMGLGDKERRRVEHGLDILNQLDVVARGAQDILSVIVREDVHHNVPEGSVGGKSRNGQRKPFYYYQIDWVREPVEKPKEVPQPRIAEVKTLHPFKRQGRNNAQVQGPPIESSRNQQRRSRAEQERFETEIKGIEEVIIDRGRELGEQSIGAGMIKFVLGEDNVAAILYNPWSEKNPDGTVKYISVDRSTGEYRRLGGTEQIRSDLLRYLDVKAQELEGKPVSYEPNPLNPDQIQASYEWAIANRIIVVTRDPSGNVTFKYLSAQSIFFSEDERGVIDLERGIVTPSLYFSRERPLHPDFAEFLRQKKLELKQTKASRKS